MTLPPRFAITEDQIDRVIAKFYVAARQDPQIGPIFAAHVADWTAHEAKIGKFWRNAILFQRGYDGNPMHVHMNVAGLNTRHFAPWLRLFDSVLAAELPQESAQAWSALTHRIARGLSYGIETYSTGATSDVPQFSPQIQGLA